MNRLLRKSRLFSNDLIQKLLRHRQFTQLLSGEYDEASALVTINAGAGGTDAQDWAEMMLKMYLRWCQSRDFKTDLLDQSAGRGRHKKCHFKVDGRYAYGYLRRKACTGLCANHPLNKAMTPDKLALLP